MGILHPGMPAVRLVPGDRVQSGLAEPRRGGGGISGLEAELGLSRPGAGDGIPYRMHGHHPRPTAEDAKPVTVGADDLLQSQGPAGSPPWRPLFAENR